MQKIVLVAVLVVLSAVNIQCQISGSTLALGLGAGVLGAALGGAFSGNSFGGPGYGNFGSGLPLNGALAANGFNAPYPVPAIRMPPIGYAYGMYIFILHVYRQTDRQTDSLFPQNEITAYIYNYIMIMMKIHLNIFTE